MGQKQTLNFTARLSLKAGTCIYRAWKIGENGENSLFAKGFSSPHMYSFTFLRLLIVLCCSVQPQTHGFPKYGMLSIALGLNMSSSIRDMAKNSIATQAVMIATKDLFHRICLFIHKL